MNPLLPAYIDFVRRQAGEPCPDFPCAACDGPGGDIFTIDGLAEALGGCRGVAYHIWTRDKSPPAGRLCEACLERLAADGSFEFVSSRCRRRKTALSAAAAMALFRYGVRQARMVMDWTEGLAGDDALSPHVLKWYFIWEENARMPERDELQVAEIPASGNIFVEAGIDLAVERREAGAPLPEREIGARARIAAGMLDRGPEKPPGHARIDIPAHPLFRRYVMMCRHWETCDDEAPRCACGAQADRTFVFDGLAESGYGSRFDRAACIWIGLWDPPEGLICDCCMKRQLDAGRFESIYEPGRGREKTLSTAAALALFRYGVRQALIAADWIAGRLEPEDLPPMLLVRDRRSAIDHYHAPARDERLYRRIDGYYLPFVGEGGDLVRDWPPDWRPLDEETIEAVALAAIETRDRAPPKG